MSLRTKNLTVRSQNSPSKVFLFENVDICYLVCSSDYQVGGTSPLTKHLRFLEYHACFQAVNSLKMLRMMLLFYLVINISMTNKKNFSTSPHYLTSFYFLSSFNYFYVIYSYQRVIIITAGERVYLHNS